MSLKTALETLVREGELYEKLENGRVRCLACGHRCIVFDGLDGVCKVRVNRSGRLWTPWGYVGALQVDPIEKKPFFHALPGSTALSFGMLGCDLHCAYCQNWISSQSIRDPGATAQPHPISPKEVVDAALRANARTVTSTYNEPLITSEWAVEIFRIARARGLRTSYVSNGNGTPEVLNYLAPWLDFIKVDLKSFRDRNYRKLGGVLRNVLETIERLHSAGIWLELVTLVVPGFNDSDEELREIAQFICRVSPDIPWHVTGFHPDYRMLEPGSTPVSTLVRAATIGVSEGLRFVYAGNRPGEAEGLEDTRCPGCRATLVRRSGFRVHLNRITCGRCPDCSQTIPGVWN